MREEYRPVVGYEGLYEVSNMGNVKSLNYNGTGKERILKAGKTDRGYLKVSLYQDGKIKQCYVHRLVAEAFIPNPNNLPIINHIDENKENNCMDNLEWCSVLYNNTYNGRANKVGKKVGKKLSKPVLAIDKRTGLILEFVSSREAERETGIDHSSITKCCNGKMNSCGGFYWMYK